MKYCPIYDCDCPYYNDELCELENAEEECDAFFDFQIEEELISDEEIFRDIREVFGDLPGFTILAEDEDFVIFDVSL